MNELITNDNGDYIKAGNVTYKVSIEANRLFLLAEDLINEEWSRPNECDIDKILKLSEVLKNCSEVFKNVFEVHSRID